MRYDSAWSEDRLMLKCIKCFVTLCALSGIGMYAQAPGASGGGRGGFGGPAIQSPQVSADGKLTIRLRAPNAKEVFLTGAGARLELTKDDRGIWTATTDTLKPDV